MLHRVQAWEAENQAVFSLGEQVELVERSGLVLNGTVCGEASGDGSVGRAQVRLDFWQSVQGEGPTGCDAPHVLGGHGERTVHQQFGRLADVQSLPVKVGAPFRHQAEGRVKPRGTSREAAGAGSLGQCDDPVVDVRPSTSRGAGASFESIEEELLDYDDEVEEHVTYVQRGDNMKKPRVVPKVVLGDHVGVRHRELVAGSLPRGEEGVFISVGLGGVREGVGDATQKVDKDICGVTNEQRKGRVDRSIQAGHVTDMGAGLRQGPGQSLRCMDCGAFICGAEKQASSRHFGRQLGLYGARVKLSWTPRVSTLVNFTDIKALSLGLFVACLADVLKYQLGMLDSQLP
ncbi:hypothetical protein NDU88_010501 [Pleurodeles waltl]|uniref:Uncharacterized protein n=1 Tax=Pleurodeles waltl TaxID=8319 RepID=A0AAV7QYZ6_PLEWA|nr:hypothetical protein NDU88_010501 [Pleurodeles waltl]